MHQKVTQIIQPVENVANYFHLRAFLSKPYEFAILLAGPRKSPSGNLFPSYMMHKLILGEKILKRKNILFLVLLLVLAYWAAKSGFAGISYKNDIVTVGSSLIGSLFVVTVFVERSTAVLNSIWFSDALQRAEALEGICRIAWCQSNYLNGQLRTDLDKAATALAAVEAERDTAQAISAFFIALFVSAAGVRTLEFLQNLPTPLPQSQLDLYHLTDIMLTAGLIAGGSAGIAALTDLLRKYIESTKAKIPII